MDKLIINAVTKKNINRLLENPPHAVILIGAEGSGKLTLAKTLAGRILNISLKNYAYFNLVEPQDGTISIEKIRQLQKFLHLKTIGGKPLRRAVIIADAQTMTVEAQNAFLKTLEEPPADTVIILTSSSDQAVLPTILSRGVSLRVLPVGELEAQAFFKDKRSPVDIKRAWILSRGQAGLLNALLDGTENNLTAQIGDAKELLGMNTFERLSKLDKYAKDKSAIHELLDALDRIARAAMQHAALNNRRAAVAKWQQIATLVNESRGQFEKNANSKLLLTNLLLNL